MNTRSMRIRIPFIVFLVAFGGSVAGGQTTPRTVTIHGVAYDSLNGAPLGGAFIKSSAGSQTATTDARGRFAIDVPVPGTHTFTMLHEALDSVGLSGVSTRASFKDGYEIVQLSVPSFATLCRIEC